MCCCGVDPFARPWRVHVQLVMPSPFHSHAFIISRFFPTPQCTQVHFVLVLVVLLPTSKNLEAEADQGGHVALVAAASSTSSSSHQTTPAPALSHPRTQAQASNMARMTAPLGQVLRRYVWVVLVCLCWLFLGRGREGQEGPRSS